MKQVPVLYTNASPLCRFGPSHDVGERERNILELEITTRCNLRCSPCPRVAFESTWVEGDMSEERFHRILQHADRFRTIYFRGWGEPLLHPLFDRMLREAHRSGAEIAVSTNGVTPIPENLLPLIHTLKFRMGCGDVRVFEKQNPGYRFNRILFNIGRISHWKKMGNHSRPTLRLQFTKNRFTLHRLQHYLELSARFRPVEVRLVEPHFLVRQIDEEGLLPGRIPADELRRIDRELEEVAQEEQLELSMGVDESHCLFNPLKHVFVNWKGQISPCRYTLLPLATQEFTVYRKGKQRLFRCVDLAHDSSPFDFSKWHLIIRNRFTPAALKGNRPGSNTLPRICAVLCSSVQCDTDEI